MLSPAASHRQRMNETTQVPTEPVILSHHESLVISQFKSDRLRLTTIRSRSRRDEAKRSLLTEYDNWIDELMCSEVFNQAQESMFVWLLLWHVDVGNWEKAVAMAAFALRKGMTTPLNFSRNLSEVIAEQVADGINRSGEHVKYRVVLESLIGLVISEDMKDQITAKLYKACGLAFIAADVKHAEAMFEKALSFNPNVGVKQLIKNLHSSPRKHKSKAYSLSAKEAAMLLNVSLPTILRHAKKYPEKLPHLLIQQGTRTVYRFNQSDVKKYKQQELRK